MRLTKLFLILCLLPFSLPQAAAQINIDVAPSYVALDAEAWNKAIQTFNTSRPWLNEQQELISSGFGFRAAVSIPVDPGLNVGVGFDLTSASSESEPFEAGISREILLSVNSISAHLEFQPFVLADSAAAAGDPLGSPLQYLYLQAGLGLNLASAEVQYDGTTEAPNGVESDFSGSGIGINIGLGYRIPLSEMFALQIETRLNWVSGLELDGLSPAINNTPFVGLQSESTLLMLSTNIGVQLAL